MFFVSLLQGGLPGPGLAVSPTLALTPQCGLDVATVPYKPQCAAGAGAGLGWVERKRAQDCCEDPHYQKQGDTEKYKKQIWYSKRLGKTRGGS